MFSFVRSWRNSNKKHSENVTHAYEYRCTCVCACVKISCPCEKRIYMYTYIYWPRTQWSDNVCKRMTTLALMIPTCELIYITKKKNTERLLNVSLFLITILFPKDLFVRISFVFNLYSYLIKLRLKSYKDTFFGIVSSIFYFI